MPDPRALRTEIEVRVRREEVSMGDSFEMYILGYSTSRRAMTYIGTVQMSEHEEGTLIRRNNSSVPLSKVAVQRLMNDLWREGVRPSEDMDEQMSIRFLKNHLADVKVLLANANNLIQQLLIGHILGHNKVDANNISIELSADANRYFSNKTEEE